MRESGGGVRTLPLYICLRPFARPRKASQLEESASPHPVSIYFPFAVVARAKRRCVCKVGSVSGSAYLHVSVRSLAGFILKFANILLIRLSWRNLTAG